MVCEIQVNNGFHHSFISLCVPMCRNRQQGEWLISARCDRDRSSDTPWHVLTMRYSASRSSGASWLTECGCSLTLGLSLSPAEPHWAVCWAPAHSPEHRSPFQPGPAAAAFCEGLEMMDSPPERKKWKNATPTSSISICDIHYTNGRLAIMCAGLSL